MLAVDAFEFLGGVVVLAFGAPVVAFAGWMIVSHLKMRSRATGTIVGIARDDEGDAHLVVEFRTQDNARVRFTNDAWAFRKPPTGRSVRVRYDARDHRDARIATFFGSWCGPLVVLLLGTFPCVLGLLGITGLLE